MTQTASLVGLCGAWQTEQTLLYVDSFMLSLTARQVWLLDPSSLGVIFSRDEKAETSVHSHGELQGARLWADGRRISESEFIK